MIVVLAAVRFFVRLYKINAVRLAPFKEILCRMAEKMAVGRTTKAKPIIMRCCL